MTSPSLNDPFAPGVCVADWGEVELLTHLRRWLGDVAPPSPQGMGDDTAVLPPRARNLLTTDSLVWQRHWDAAVTPAQAGGKLLKRNLSDLAAMGGRPAEAVMAAFLPAQTSVAWLEAFVRGLAEGAKEWQVPLVGGDLTESASDLAFNLTLLGHAESPITRGTAKPGDTIWVTGSLGGSRATHHFAFTPRLAAGQWLAARSDVTAMIDVTDGLGKDLPALLAPNAAAAVDWPQVPVREAVTAQTREPSAQLAAALFDGEDYELLFALRADTPPAALRADWDKAPPDRSTTLTCVGKVVARPTSGNRLLNLPTFSGHAYEHFR